MGLCGTCHRSQLLESCPPLPSHWTLHLLWSRHLREKLCRYKTNADVRKKKERRRKVTFIWMWKSGFWEKLREVKESKTLFRGAASSRTALTAWSPFKDSVRCPTKWLSRLISTNARKPSICWRTVPPAPSGNLAIWVGSEDLRFKFG